MGEKRRRLAGRELVLNHNPFCVYCGSEAKTTDHCPPRCFFIGRRWPESFEFSCCTNCNDLARQDEQALAVLVRVRPNQAEAAAHEWKKLVDGLRNNQPHYIDEWTSIKRNDVKKSLRSSFGKEGDTMRARGWGALYLGPLTRALIERFLYRLTTALYYHRNGERFIRVVHYLRQSSYNPKFDIKSFWEFLKFAPELVVTERNTEDLSDQFMFRCNYAPDPCILFAVVAFNPQQIFTLCAFSPKAIAGLNALRRSSGQLELPSSPNSIHNLTYTG